MLRFHDPYDCYNAVTAINNFNFLRVFVFANLVKLQKFKK